MDATVGWVIIIRWSILARSAVYAVTRREDEMCAYPLHAGRNTSLDFCKIEPLFFSGKMFALGISYHGNF